MGRASARDPIPARNSQAVAPRTPHVTDCVLSDVCLGAGVLKTPEGHPAAEAHTQVVSNAN